MSMQPRLMALIALLLAALLVGVPGHAQDMAAASSGQGAGTSEAEKKPR